MGAGAVAMMEEGSTFGLTDLQRHLGKVLSAANEAPVTLTKSGKPVAMLVNLEAYKAMAHLEEVVEDLYWTVTAMRHDVEWARNGKHSVSLSEVDERARVRG